MAETLKERVVRGMMWGGMNTVVQQGVGVLFGIILGRLLVPGDYGMIAMINIFVMIANALQISGFRTALTNLDAPRHEDYNAVFWFNIGMGCGLYALLFVAAPWIAEYYETEGLVALSRYAFLAVVVNSLGTAQYAWLFKNLRAKQQAKAGMTAVVTSSVVGVSMAYAGCSYWSLATQNIVYVAMNTAGLWVYSEWRPSVRNITMEPVRRMFRFSCKILATDVAYHINNNVLNVLLGKYFGEYRAGIYNQAYQWNFKGYNVVQNMILTVAQPVLVDLRSDGGRRLAALRKMVRFTAFLTFPLMLGFGLVADEFIRLALTEKWAASAQLLRIMCVSGAVAPVSTLLGNLVISEGKSGTYFGVTAALCVTLIGTMVALHGEGLHAMVVVYTVIISCWVFVWLAFVKRVCGYGLWQFMTDTLPFALAAVGTMTLTHFATAGIANLWLLLAARVAMAATVYFVVMKVARVRILDECLRFVLRK